VLQDERRRGLTDGSPQMYSTLKKRSRFRKRRAEMAIQALF